MSSSEPQRRSTPASISSAALVEQLSAHAPTQSRYTLNGELARGGMGAILHVRDEDLQRDLAMKVILGRSGATESGPPVDDQALARFLEEAQITGQLDHPGVVPVHELGLDSDGHVYFTMRLVQGEEFGAVIDKVRAGDPEWTLVRALGVLLRVCETVAYAHSKGVIHRDLKPDNLMVGRFGEVYVMDWGLAKSKHGRLASELDALHARAASGAAPSDAGESASLTMDGSVIGTPAYMSPEQARGEIADIDERSDVYCLGAILYHLVTGRAPYSQESDGAKPGPIEILTRVLEGAPEALPIDGDSVPQRLVAICRKALERDRAQRFASAQELAIDLRGYLEGSVLQPMARSGSVATWLLDRAARVGWLFTVFLVAPILVLMGALWLRSILNADAPVALSWTIPARLAVEHFGLVGGDAESAWLEPEVIIHINSAADLGPALMLLGSLAFAAASVMVVLFHTKRILSHVAAGRYFHEDSPKRVRRIASVATLWFIAYSALSWLLGWTYSDRVYEHPELGQVVPVVEPDFQWSWLIVALVLYLVAELLEHGRRVETHYRQES